ncbi:hypothetical protein F8A87_03235 [Betaproteobacteria bacterium SCN2]|jgi:hypothetical protein|nr:hypothetical protein F8A87_03235 [Betaproteobacteria bacterium SCN2]
MANAVRDIAKFIKRNPESDDATVLWELCKALESESSFELHRLFGLKLKAFELAMGLLDAWRIDRLIAERRIQKYLDLSED